MSRNRQHEELEAELKSVREQLAQVTGKARILEASLFAAHRYEDITHEANRECVKTIGRLEAALRTILKGFDEGFFVRDISHDNESGWLVRLLPYIVALGRGREELEVKGESQANEYEFRCNRFRPATEQPLQVEALLRRAEEFVCSQECQSVWKTAEKQSHGPTHQAIMDYFATT